MYAVGAFFVLVFAFVGGAWGEEAQGPSDKGSALNPGELVISLFRDHISAVDGDRCPSFPSCSAYGTEAFKKHGFVMGWLMTVDRLIHEADEGDYSPRVYHGGRMKIYDPVAQNDFWWYKPDERQDKKEGWALDDLLGRNPF